MKGEKSFPCRLQYEGKGSVGLGEGFRKGEAVRRPI